MTSTRSTPATCASCDGSGRVPDLAVSQAFVAVSGVRTTVRRPCPHCAGGAAIGLDHDPLDGPPMP